MIRPITIPRGVANIFLLGLANIDIFDEQTQYRPDKIHDRNSLSGIKNEMVDNYLSVLSPISARKGQVEILADGLFKSYFEVQ